MTEQQQFVQWFRQSSPYINAHRGRTLVVSVGGELLASDSLRGLVQDLALLNGLGVRLVLVVGARPQVEARLAALGAEPRYHDGLRITDDQALACLREAVGSLRVDLEARLSMGVANSPMAGFRIRVASGNFVIAKPMGVREGVDYLHTGEVRRIDGSAIHERLEAGCVVLVAPLGYSPTGEVFNVAAEDVALATAQELRADKLIYLAHAPLNDRDSGTLIPELGLHEAVRERDRLRSAGVDDTDVRLLDRAVRAVRGGVQRVHLVDRHCDGGLLLELFTRDGVGTLIAGDPYETVRRARVDDVGGILELIEPLEAEGVLVRRSREQLETGIDDYVVVERDGMVIATAALSLHTHARMAELGCFVIHPDYQGGRRGETLLRHVEREARGRGVDRLFVLTTRAAHWFQERGFETGNRDDLPMERQALYNSQRNSRVLIKALR